MSGDTEGNVRDKAVQILQGDEALNECGLSAHRLASMARCTYQVAYNALIHLEEAGTLRRWVGTESAEQRGRRACWVLVDPKRPETPGCALQSAWGLQIPKLGGEAAPQPQPQAPATEPLSGPTGVAGEYLRSFVVKRSDVLDDGFTLGADPAKPGADESCIFAYRSNGSIEIIRAGRVATLLEPGEAEQLVEFLQDIGLA